jgi:UDP:flavonoid glycosyltransferase YjiC (YdhE family)
VHPDAVTPALLRAAVDRVIAGSGFRDAAAGLRSSLAEAGGATAAADAVLAFTRGEAAATTLAETGAA